MEIDPNSEIPSWKRKKDWEEKKKDWDSCGTFHDNDRKWDDWGEGDFEDDYSPGPAPKELGNFDIADEYQTTIMTPKDDH
jgi:hypothetical protein